MPSLDSGHYIRPWTLRALRMVYESPEPVAREIVVYEASLLVPPAVAVHTLQLASASQKRRYKNKTGRVIDRLSLMDPEDRIDAGRRRVVMPTLRQQVRKGRLALIERDGVKYYTVGPSPFSEAHLYPQEVDE